MSSFDKYNPYSYKAIETRIKAGEFIPADDLVGALKFNVPSRVEMPVTVLEYLCLRLAGKVKKTGRTVLDFKEKSKAVAQEQLAVDYYYRVLEVLERVPKPKTRKTDIDTLAIQAAKQTLAMFFKGRRNMTAQSFQNNILSKYPDPRKRQ